MEKLFIKQKEKGGIIDLEEEQKKFLVVTNNGEQESEENKFTELSPTDYQLGLLWKNVQKQNCSNSNFIDDVGVPCAKTSPPKSPEKSSNNGGEYEDDYSYNYQSYQNNHHYGYGKGRGRGRGGKRGFHKNSSER